MGKAGEVLMPYSKYSPKQKKLAAMAGNRKKITAADLAADLKASAIMLLLHFFVAVAKVKAKAKKK